jgi:hypothetical protein
MLEITGVDIITVNSLTSTTTSVASTTTIGNSTTTTTLANATTTTSTTSTTTVPFFVGTPRGFLDSPADGSVLSGNALLGGWAAIMNGDTAGMASRVDLLVDGVLASIMNLGVIRQDVKQYFATQGVSAPDNLGFFGAWDSRTVFDGTHQLAIRAADSTGGRQEGMAEVARISVITSNGIQTTTTTTTITTTTATTSTTLAVGQSAHGNLESPSQGQAIFSSGTGSGWAFLLSSNTGMLPSRIDILADGFVISQATLGISRPDVRDHFATLGISVPPDTGFLFNWDRAWMPVGTRTLAVRAVDAVGNGTVIAQITVQVIESQTP